MQLKALFEIGEKVKGEFVQLDPNTEIVQDVVYEFRFTSLISLSPPFDAIIAEIIKAVKSVQGMEVIWMKIEGTDVSFQAVQKTTIKVGPIPLLILIIIAIVALGFLFNQIGKVVPSGPAGQIFWAAIGIAIFIGTVTFALRTFKKEERQEVFRKTGIEVF